jgi:hypothetical protein
MDNSSALITGPDPDIEYTSLKYASTGPVSKMTSWVSPDAHNE